MPFINPVVLSGCVTPSVFIRFKCPELSMRLNVANTYLIEGLVRREAMVKH